MSDITIRMPQDLLDKCLATLRGGKVKQGKRCLFDGEGYCCLGVLQAIETDGKIEVHGRDFRGHPSSSWLRSAGITFLTESGGKDDSPYLPTLGKTASTANDFGFTFPELADAIEACAEGY